MQALEQAAFHFAFMLVNNRALAEEVVQESFARAWASPHTPSSEPEFRRWIYRLITNLARDLHRRQTVWNRLRFWLPQAPDPLHEIARRIGDQEIGRTLRRLPLRERQVVYLHFFEDRSHADIAQILQIKESTARVLLNRALQRMRRLPPGTLLEETS